MDDQSCCEVEIRTARLLLLRPGPGDIDMVYSLHHDPRACAHNPSDMLESRADAEDRYRLWDKHWRRHGVGYWAVCDQGTSEVLGFCGLKVMQLANLEVLNLFYRLDPQVWGNGIATEAAIAAVDWAIAHRPDHPVVARVRPDNGGSIRVATRVGLQRAEHLDSPGEDGLDWIFALNWDG